MSNFSEVAANTVGPRFQAWSHSTLHRLEAPGNVCEDPRVRTQKMVRCVTMDESTQGLVTEGMEDTRRAIHRWACGPLSAPASTGLCDGIDSSHRMRNPGGSLGSRENAAFQFFGGVPQKKASKSDCIVLGIMNVNH